MKCIQFASRIISDSRKFAQAGLVTQLSRRFKEMLPSLDPPVFLSIKVEHRELGAQTYDEITWITMLLRVKG